MCIGAVHSTIPLRELPQSQSTRFQGKSFVILLSFPEIFSRKAPTEIQVRAIFSWPTFWLVSMKVLLHAA
jgi:hypothetical protein